MTKTEYKSFSNEAIATVLEVQLKALPWFFDGCKREDKIQVLLAFKNAENDDSFVVAILHNQVFWHDLQNAIYKLLSYDAAKWLEKSE